MIYKIKLIQSGLFSANTNIVNCIDGMVQWDIVVLLCYMDCSFLLLPGLWTNHTLHIFKPFQLTDCSRHLPGIDEFPQCSCLCREMLWLLRLVVLQADPDILGFTWQREVWRLCEWTRLPTTASSPWRSRKWEAVRFSKNLNVFFFFICCSITPTHQH